MTVVLLSNDLAVLSRVEGVAIHCGRSVRSTSNESQAVEVCEREGAATLVIDLSMQSLDVASLVKQLKQNEGNAPRVVAFGPHVHEQRLAAAREAGCDLVVSRGQFFSQLDVILTQ